MKKNGFPAPYPHLNLLNCFLDDSLLTKPIRQSYIYEYYINLNIKKLNLSEDDHNYIIFIIFLLAIARKES
jgi:hypothetical protein